MNLINKISVSLVLALLCCDNIYVIIAGIIIIGAINYIVPVLLDNLAEAIDDYKYGKENRHREMAYQRIQKSKKRIA